jgi:APA family basic amino acid/polyamine antiporter
MMGQSRLLYALAKDGLFFSWFSELSPKTHVPVKGGWVSCIVICILSVILDVEELAFVISIENLFTYSIVNAGLIALRFREQPEVRTKTEWYAWGYMVIAFVFSLSWGYEWHWFITTVLGILVILSIIGLHFVPQLAMKYYNPDVDQLYLCPLVPLIPCLGVLTTLALCSGIPPKIWLFFGLFELIGVAFYFFYGVKHSVVNEKYL